MLSGPTWVFGLVSKLGCMVTPCSGRGWVAWLLPAGGEGGLHGYSPLGERVGCRVTSRWGSWFYGYFLLGKLVSGLLPAGGEGGLHGYSPLGERVGCMVTSRWGSWFYCYFPLGKLVSGLRPAGGEGGLHGYSPLGEWVS